MPASNADPVEPIAAPLLALVSDVVLWLDDQLCVLRANDAALRLLRQPVEMIFGLSLEQLVAPASRKSLDAYVKERGARPHRVSYKENRCVLFDSTLFHATDELHFKPGYSNRRVNVTLLYGKALHF